MPDSENVTNAPQTATGDTPTRDRTPQVRGSYRKGRQRRAEILNAATEVFALSGYHASSIAAVAERVGLTVPGLLHHFPTKLDLLVAVLEERDQGSRELMPALPASWQDLLRGLVAIAHHNERIPDIVGYFALVQSESLQEGHPAAEWFERRNSDLMSMLCDGFRNGLAQGTLKPGSDPDALAAELIAMMDGLQIQWLRSKNTLPMADIFEAYVMRLITDVSVPQD